MAAFADTDELIRFARTFLRDRTASLESDVLVCTTHGASATFPAILYCFSTIDLLGALLAGNAKREPGVTGRATAYARRFMHYSDDQCKLLWDLFRHKIVHLAQPKAVKHFNGNGKNTTWRYWHNDGAHDLKLVPLVPPVRVAVASGLSFEVEQQFEISIRHLIADVVDSVHAPGGYLHTLGSDPCLQKYFDNAVMDIYGP
jgi:hypothetical protein